ncbi:MAG: hypothetical protein RLZZ623_3162 [Actinomycetota bacterium]
MLMYSRTLSLRGPLEETATWAAEVTAHVNATTNLDVGCWLGLYGLPLGSMGWSAVVEGHAHVAEQGAILGADKAFQALVNSAADWVTEPGQDHLRNVISGARTDGERPAVGAVAQLTTAVVALGRVGEAMAWGVDIAEYTAELSGAPVMFCADLYGTFGSVAWISVVDDLATVDRTQAAINGDEGYLKRISMGADLFVPASGNTSLLTRIA